MPDERISEELMVELEAVSWEEHNGHTTRALITELRAERERSAEKERKMEQVMDWLVDGLEYGAGVSTTPRLPADCRRLLAEAWSRSEGGAVEDYEAMIEVTECQ